MEEDITYATVVIKDGERSPNGKRVSHLTFSNVGAFSRYGQNYQKNKTRSSHAQISFLTTLHGGTAE